MCTRKNIACKSTPVTNEAGVCVKWSGEHDPSPDVAQCEVLKSSEKLYVCVGYA